MSETKELEIYARAVARFGYKHQLAMIQEECAELIHAVSKALRNNEPFGAALASEAADVEIMLGQLRWIMGDTQIDEQKKLKLERLNRLIGGCPDNFEPAPIRMCRSGMSQCGMCDLCHDAKKWESRR